MWYPDVTVAAICFADGRFLMVEERSKSTNQIVFNQPAGHLEEGESILDAVIRETREESCRHFVPESLVGIYHLRAKTGKTYLRFAFTGTISDLDTSLELDKDIIRNHWLTLEEIQNNQQLRSPIVLDCINDYLQGKRYPLELLRPFSNKES